MPEITIKLSDSEVAAAAEQYRADKDDGPLTDKQKAGLYLVQHCGEVEFRKRQRIAKNAVKRAATTQP